jgi:hypothetical protein
MNVVSMAAKTEEDMAVERLDNLACRGGLTSFVLNIFKHASTSSAVIKWFPSKSRCKDPHIGRLFVLRVLASIMTGTGIAHGKPFGNKRTVPDPKVVGSDDVLT